jgi:glutaconate CoA-transferase subunit B
MRHEPRKLRERISFITSPGYLDGGDTRAQARLAGGPSRVITDKAVLGFEPESKRMMLLSIHPGTTLDDVLANTGFAPIVPAHLPVTQPPTAEQLRLIREVIDPQRMYVG